jgi:hypothetical protein
MTDKNSQTSRDVTETTAPTPASLTAPPQGHTREASEGMSSLEGDLDEEVLGHRMPPLPPHPAASSVSHEQGSSRDVDVEDDGAEDSDATAPVPMDVRWSSPIEGRDSEVASVDSGEETDETFGEPVRNPVLQGPAETNRSEAISGDDEMSDAESVDGSFEGDPENFVPPIFRGLVAASAADLSRFEEPSAPHVPRCVQGEPLADVPEEDEEDEDAEVPLTPAPAAPAEVIAENEAPASLERDKSASPPTIPSIESSDDEAAQPELSAGTSARPTLPVTEEEDGDPESSDDDVLPPPAAQGKGKRAMTEEEAKKAEEEERDRLVALKLHQRLEENRSKTESSEGDESGDEEERPKPDTSNDHALAAALGKQPSFEGSVKPAKPAQLSESKPSVAGPSVPSHLRGLEPDPEKKVEAEQEDDGEDEEPLDPSTLQEIRLDAKYPPKDRRLPDDKDEVESDLGPAQARLLALLNLKRRQKPGKFIGTLRRFTIPDAFVYRDDKEFREVLGTPIPLDLLPEELRTGLNPGTTEISLLGLWEHFNQSIIDHLKPVDGMDAIEAKKLDLVRRGVSHVLESQQEIMQRMMGSTSMGGFEKAGHLLHAGLLSTLPFIVAFAGEEINGGYLGAWAAAFSRYGINAVRRVLGGNETSATIFDSYVSSFYTYSVNASFFAIPTALRKTKLTSSIGFLAGAAIYDFVVLNRLENWAGTWESLRYPGGSKTRDGKVPLPDKSVEFIGEVVPKINLTVTAIKDLRKQFGDDHYAITSGMSAQMSRLISDTARLDKMFNRAMELARSGVAVDLTEKTLSERAREIPGNIYNFGRNLPGNLAAAPGAALAGVKREWSVLNEVDDKVRKGIVSGLLVGMLTLQVVFTSGNAALLPDFIAYLLYSGSATYSKFKNPGNTLQDVQQLFSDLAAGSVVGTPYNAVLFKKPEYFEPERFPIAFAVLVGYLLLCSLTIAPLMGEFTAWGLNKIFGGVTFVFAKAAEAYAAHNRSRAAAPPDGDDDDDDPNAIVLERYGLGDALRDAQNLPEDQVRGFLRLMPPAGFLPGGSISDPSDQREEGGAFIEELPPTLDLDTSNFGKDFDGNPLSDTAATATNRPGSSTLGRQPPQRPEESTSARKAPSRDTEAPQIDIEINAGSLMEDFGLSPEKTDPSKVARDVNTSPR